MFVTADYGVAAAVVKRFAPRRRCRAYPTLREYEARPTEDSPRPSARQLPNRRLRAGPANTSASRAMRPPASEPLSMPADNGVWLDDDERRAPVPPRVSECHPKQAISRTERGALDRAREYGQLLTECHILERACAVSCAHQREGSNEYDKPRQHGLSCRAVDHRINWRGWRSSSGEGQAAQLLLSRGVMGRADHCDGSARE